MNDVDVQADMLGMEALKPSMARVHEFVDLLNK